MAYAAGYGVGKATHTITMDGEVMKCVMATGFTEDKYSWTPDGTKRDDDGCGNSYTAEWKGDYFIVTPGDEVESAKAQTFERYMEGDKMVLKQMYAKKNLTMYRKYTKQ